MTIEPASELPEIEVEEFHSLMKKKGDALVDWIEGLSSEEIAAVLSELNQTIRQQEARFACMQEIGVALGETTHLDEHLNLIMENITQLMEAERSTLFLVDPDTGELWSKFSEGENDTEIRLEPGEGIAGWVAATGKSINIDDAYHDARFSPMYDVETGFNTESILCQPIRDQEDSIIGVVQVLNSLNGQFDVRDENLLSAIASQTAVAIENSKLYLSVVDKNFELLETKRKLEERVAELDVLFELEREVSQLTELDEVIYSLLEKSTRILDAEIASLYLRNDDKPTQIYMQNKRSGEPSCRSLESEPAIAKQVIESGESYFCNSRESENISDALEEFVGGKIRNLIAVPLMEEGRCIGALNVMNRHDESGGVIDFQQNELRLLRLMGGQIASNIMGQRRREEQKKQNRLASIGRMLSGVIHDLQNPITIINGYVQLMTKADQRSKREQYADDIQKQFEHLDQMTRELLVFARGDTRVEPEEIGISNFIQEVCELLEPEFDETDINISTDLNYSGRVSIDVGKLKRVVLNLAQNAADAMEGEGEFRIEVEYDTDGDELVLYFSDTGRGIPEDVRNSLFDTFVTKGKSNGTGLGLAIVEKIVEEHGGHIDFETEDGEGTTFEVRLPQSSV